MPKTITELIQQHSSTFSNVDRQIASFILNHAPEIPSLSINNIATKAFVSTSSVLRFAQKLGFNGYSDFKYSISWEPSITTDNAAVNSHQLGQALTTLIDGLNDNNLQQTLQLIHNSHRIFVLATGLNQQYQARDLQQHFLQLGINMILLPATTGSELNKQVAETVSKQDLLIVFSSSGENHVVKDFLKIPILVEVPIVAFTNNLENWLSNHANYTYSMDPLPQAIYPYFSGFFHIVIDYLGTRYRLIYKA